MQRALRSVDDSMGGALVYRNGDPTDEIIRVAEREHCDLIAMSTHGHRFVKDVVLGSVASAVRHRTDIPVLMVRAKLGAGVNE